MKKIFLGLLFVSSLASAAHLEDVQILDIKSGADQLEVKLHSMNSRKESIFFVNIVKTDPNSFDKLSYVIKKLMYQSNYKLNLNIPSFSPSPNGSYYLSPDIDFSSSSIREPNSISKKKKIK